MPNPLSLKPVVLIVDDEPNVLAALKRSWGREQFEVLTAGSGDEALKTIRRRSVDLIVADHDMPEMTGVDLLTTVRREYPEIIRFMLTGKASVGVAADAINEGEVTRFYSKPIEAADLATAINLALENRQLRQQISDLLLLVRSQKRLLDRAEIQYASQGNTTGGAGPALPLDF